MTWPRQPHDPSTRPSQHATYWNPLILGFLALALLLMAACGQPAHAALPGHTTATATRTSGFHLDWRPANVPQANVFAIAPGDGDIAYACQVKGPRQISISVTRNRAVYWAHAGDIALAEDANQCFIAVDGLQPTTVVITVIWEPKGASPITAFTISYVTFDGGATWRRLSGPRPYWVFRFSTLDGVIYGYMRVSVGEQEISELAVSRDQMRTWRPVLDKMSDSPGITNTYFWLNPDNGALLARGGSAFWASDDAGSHWRRVDVPGLTTQGTDTVVQAPAAHQPWRLCAVGDDELNPRDTKPNTLTCSFDGGQTWQSEPGLNVILSSVKGTFATPTTVFALASDGAILATSSGGSDPATDSQYRLLPGARTWQSLGEPTGASGEALYYPAPGGGVLWDGIPGGYVTASYP